MSGQSLILTRSGISAVGLAVVFAIALRFPSAVSSSSATSSTNTSDVVATLCLPSLQDRQVRSVFQDVDTLAQHPEQLGRAMQAIQEAARCFPSDGVPWTAMALLELANNGNTPAFRIFFQRSVLLSPSEATAIKRRLTALLSLRDRFPELLQANLDRYLQNAVHADISDFLRPLPDDQRAFVIARMRMLSNAQIERWFQGHPNQAGLGR